MKPLLLILAAAALYAQEPKNICGLNSPNVTANITLLQVNCVDYEAWRRFAPEFDWPVGTSTNFVIHVRRGDAVKVTVDGVTKLADLIFDPNYGGRYVALVQFEGIEHKKLDVRVYAEVQ